MGEPRVALVYLAHWKPCSTSPALPWGPGASVPHLPRSYATLRRPPAPLGACACRSFPDPLRASFRLWSPRRARGRVEAPRQRQGLWSPAPPVREYRQGARWLSQVPPSPCEDMPRSQTPVGSCALAKTPPGRLPSSHWKPSASHDSTHCGAPARRLSPCYPRLRTAPDGEARGGTTDRRARL